RHLVRHQLALLDRLLRHGQYSLGAQRGIVGTVDLEDHVLTRRLCILFLRLSMQARAGHQLRGAAKVCDELTYGDSLGIAVVDDGVVQDTRGDPAVAEGPGSGQTAVGERVVGRLYLGHDLTSRECTQL